MMIAHIQILMTAVFEVDIINGSYNRGRSVALFTRTEVRSGPKHILICSLYICVPRLR